MLHRLIDEHADGPHLHALERYAAGLGCLMSVNSSVQQISGGIALAVAGLIVVQTETGRLERYDVLGYVGVVAMSTTSPCCTSFTAM